MTVTEIGIEQVFVRSVFKLNLFKTCEDVSHNAIRGKLHNACSRDEQKNQLICKTGNVSSIKV